MFTTGEQQRKFETTVFVASGIVALLVLALVGVTTWLAWWIHPALGVAVALAQTLIVVNFVRGLFK